MPPVRPVSGGGSMEWLASTARYWSGGQSAMCGGEGKGDLRHHAALGERGQQRRGREGVERQQRVLRVVRHAQRLDLMRGKKETSEKMRGKEGDQSGDAWQEQQRGRRASTTGLGR